MVKIEDIIRLAKSRGFIFNGSEIYGGFANSYTYGPLGVELKNNIKNLWWKRFVQDRQDMTGIDGGILLHPRTWEASGHVSGFNDQQVDCRDCKSRFRADHLVEDATGQDCEGMKNSEVSKKIREKKIKCPKCGSLNLTEVRQFNLMFETEMSKISDENSTAYLRPETAQAIFLEFKNVLQTSRKKIPFGIGQIGKAFRNEITPGNYIFRLLEFEQMEIEYFIAEKFWKKEFSNWLMEQHNWCKAIGLRDKNIREKEHTPEKLSHYSKRTVDIEYRFPFGWKELYGLAYRTDFDLSQHQKFSGQKLQYFDEKTKQFFIPHVIEPTFGLDRTILAVLCDSFKEEKLKDGTERTVLGLSPALSPVKVAVLPLMKKDGLPEKAQKIRENLLSLGNIDYDLSGAIGKRYRRQDEIGTPVCVTIDFETLEDDSVTIRDRDNMKQKRVSSKSLVQTLKKTYFKTLEV